jgi:hypothetical protein
MVPWQLNYQGYVALLKFRDRAIIQKPIEAQSRNFQYLM